MWFIPCNSLVSWEKNDTRWVILLTPGQDSYISLHSWHATRLIDWCCISVFFRFHWGVHRWDQRNTGGLQPLPVNADGNHHSAASKELFHMPIRLMNLELCYPSKLLLTRPVWVHFENDTPWHQKSLNLWIFSSSSVNSWLLKMTSAHGERRRAWWECPGSLVRNGPAILNSVKFQSSWPDCSFFLLALSVCSSVALSQHVTDFPPPAGGDQPASAASCWTGSVRRGI